MKLTKVALASGIAFSSLVLPTISYAESTVAFKTTTMYTNHGVHARKAPNVKADIIKTIPKNTKIQHFLIFSNNNNYLNKTLYKIYIILSPNRN